VAFKKQYLHATLQQYQMGTLVTYFPFSGVSHHNISALFVVLSDTHLGDIIRPFNP
jgi:hypothetical protein